jgi:photosystem II stability/assembly factor-like uncharacterized protein
VYAGIRRLNGIARSEDGIIAVGAGGTLVRSTDRGLSWYDRRSGSVEFRAVASEGDVFVAVGDRGAIARSTDGGATWQAVASTGLATMTDIAALGAGRWVAAGSPALTLVSDDDGVTWSSVPISDDPRYDSTCVLNVFGFFDAEHGFVAIIDSVPWLQSVFVTSDGGRTWDSAPASAPETEIAASARAFARLGPGRGIVVGASYTSYSETYGTTWSRRFTETPFGYYDMDWGDSLHGIIVIAESIPKDRDVAEYTTDGGATWRRSVIVADSALFSADIMGLAFASPLVAVAVDGYGRIFRTADGGASWNMVAQDYLNLQYASFADPANGVAIGASTSVVVTNDSGKTWSRAPERIRRNPQAGPIAGVQCLSADIWFVLYSGMDTPAWRMAFVYRTTDAGRTWTEAYLGTVNTRRFRRDRRGRLWVPGHSGYPDRTANEVWSTVDTGRTWIRDELKLGDSTLLVDLVIHTSGYGIGSKSWISRRVNLLLTSDRGRTFVESPPPTGTLPGKVELAEHRFILMTAEQRLFARALAPGLASGGPPVAIADAPPRIHPNPASDEITVQFAEAAASDLVITDVVGVRYYTGNADDNGVARVNVATWPSGLYVLHVADAAAGYTFFIHR